MSEALFLKYIRENSFDLAFEMLIEYGNQISNAKDSNGTTALMLSAKLKPPSKAVLLMSSLLHAGAVFETKNNRDRQLLLYACHAGVDPIIFELGENMTDEELQEMIGM
jgi:ankyrin repeat protein